MARKATQCQGQRTWSSPTRVRRGVSKRGTHDAACGPGADPGASAGCASPKKNTARKRCWVGRVGEKASGAFGVEVLASGLTKLVVGLVVVTLETPVFEIGDEISAGRGVDVGE